MLTEIFEAINIVRGFALPDSSPASDEPEIFVGDVVYFVDDETGVLDCGSFLGFHTDIHPSGESSPYWAEHCQGIHRVWVREFDGKTNYILPENVFTLNEVEGHVFDAEAS